jgi:hypothetical protein
LFVGFVFVCRCWYFSSCQWNHQFCIWRTLLQFNIRKKIIRCKTFGKHKNKHEQILFYFLIFIYIYIWLCALQGQKTGKGYYKYEKAGKPTPDPQGIEVTTQNTSTCTQPTSTATQYLVLFFFVILHTCFWCPCRVFVCFVWFVCLFVCLAFFSFCSFWSSWFVSNCELVNRWTNCTNRFISCY